MCGFSATASTSCLRFPVEAIPRSVGVSVFKPPRHAVHSRCSPARDMCSGWVLCPQFKTVHGWFVVRGVCSFVFLLCDVRGASPPNCLCGFAVCYLVALDPIQRSGCCKLPLAASVGLGCANIEVSRHTSAVFALALFTVGRVDSVRRIIGTAISYSATSFTLTRWCTRRHSERQNWVRSSGAPFIFSQVVSASWPRSLRLSVLCEQKNKPPTEPCCAGHMVWRRHARTSNPTRHQLRATCMELLPLVEMYCKYELQEDCTNLRSLMLCFDSERELETYELGRSLLLMLRDDDDGMDFSTHRLHLDVPSNPFDAIRGRIADIDLVF